MNTQGRPARRRANALSTNYYFGLVIVAALASLTGTFLLLNSAASSEAKARGFWAIVAAFIFVACLCIYRVQSHRGTPQETSTGDQAGADDRLAALDEASEIFAGSVDRRDMFRLLASRLCEIVPARAVVLYLLDDTRLRLEVAEMAGREAVFVPDTFDADTCFVKRSVHVAESGVVGIPLLHELEPFGVIEFHFDQTDRAKAENKLLFDAIGTRVAPLIVRSLAFECTVSNALTDATTDLPNERALFLILEKQIAESQRRRDERPLTLLAIDVKNFDEINRRFGHAAGDRALAQVAHIVRDNLRQMDFLARCQDDEFLAVLPTASKDVSFEVIARVHTAFFGRRLRISDQEPIEIELNIASSVFGHDGETAEQLIAAARLRKEQIKSAVTSRVVWFPQEAAN